MVDVVDVAPTWVERFVGCFMGDVVADFSHVETGMIAPSVLFTPDMVDQLAGHILVVMLATKLDTVTSPVQSMGKSQAPAVVAEQFKVTAIATRSKVKA